MDSVQSNYVGEWRSVTLVLTNQSKRPIRCTPRAIITKDGQLCARTKVPRHQLWLLGPGEHRQIRGTDIFGSLIITENAAHITPAWQALPDTGMLTLCIHVTDSMGIEHFAAPLCRTLSVFAWRLPLPIAPTPTDTVVLQHRTMIGFAWLPVYPARPGTCYIVRCHRLPDTLTIAEAVRIQQPLLEQRVCNGTQLRWQAKGLSPGTYVWSVQALDQLTELPIGSSDGYSITVPFTIRAALPNNSKHHRRRLR